MAKEQSAKYNQARGGLPEKMKPVFDKLVEDYRFAALTHHGAPYVSYIVLAELVKVGWRPLEQPKDSE